MRQGKTRGIVIFGEEGGAGIVPLFQYVKCIGNLKFDFSNFTHFCDKLPNRCFSNIRRNPVSFELKRFTIRKSPIQTGIKLIVNRRQECLIQGRLSCPHARGGEPAEEIEEAGYNALQVMAFTQRGRGRTCAPASR